MHYWKHSNYIAEAMRRSRPRKPGAETLGFGAHPAPLSHTSPRRGLRGWADGAGLRTWLRGNREE